MLEIIHPEDRPLFDAYVDADDFGDPLCLRCRHRDGQVMWLEQRGVPVYDDGQPVALDGIVRDVSEIQRLRQGLDQRSRSLEEKDRLLSSLQEVGQATLASLDMEEVLDTLAAQIARTGIFQSLMVALVDHEIREVRVARNYLAYDPEAGMHRDEVVGGGALRISEHVTRRVGDTILYTNRKIIGTTYPLDDDNITPTVARTGKLEVIDGWDDRFDQNSGGPSSREGRVAYFIPVRLQDRTLAVLATGSDRASKAEMLRRIDAMQPLLDQVAVALDHASLYERARTQALSLRETNEQLLSEIARRRSAEQKLRSFSSRTVRYSEEERGRVARELHDGVNQLLCAVGFGLEVAAKDISETDGEALGGLKHARTLLDRSIDEIRRISQDLRPGVLDDLGLVPAVRSLCEQFEQRTETAVALDFGDFPGDLPSELRTSVYRFLQGALYSLHRDAQMSAVELSMRMAGTALEAVLEADCQYSSDSAFVSMRTAVDTLRENVSLVGGAATHNFHKARHCLRGSFPTYPADVS